MEERLVVVACEKIKVSPFQPRTLFNEEEIQELALSIKESGLIQPLVVREIKSRDTLLYYELIAGERRLRAAKKAGYKEVTVLVRQVSDNEAAKATLIENIQRVNLDPIETARAFLRLTQVFKMTQEQIAEKVGKKRSTVANYLRLLALPKHVQGAIESGEITMGHAKALLSLNESKLQELLHKSIVDNTLSVREAEKQSRQLSAKKAVKKDPNIASLEGQLSERFKTKVTLVPSKQGGGTLSFHYYNPEDLEAILESFDVFV